MRQTTYKSYDELPLVLSVPKVVAVLGIVAPGPMSWRGAMGPLR